jgi:hypothetical protein
MLLMKLIVVTYDDECCGYEQRKLILILLPINLLEVYYGVDNQEFEDYHPIQNKKTVIYLGLRFYRIFIVEENSKETT